MRRAVVTALPAMTHERPSRTLARRRVTERIFVEQRADRRFASLSDEQLRAAIDAFLDEELAPIPTGVPAYNPKLRIT